VILIVGRKVGNALVVGNEEFHGHQASALSRLEAEPRGTLSECLDSGRPVVVEMPDHRLVAIQAVEENDDLVDDLLESNPAFRDIVAKSKASPRRPFSPR
jgi:hypothetical protein